MTWDPEQTPDPEAWLALDDDRRADVIRAWHEDNPTPGLHPPDYNLTLHASLHAVIENQIATSDPPVTARTVARLQEAGLRRHAAVHAVMRVLTERIAALTSGRPYDADAFEAALEALKPEDAIPVQGLGWAADPDEPPRNRTERRARKKGGRRRR